MQPPNLLVTRLKIQELYPLPVIFPLISLARGNFPLPSGLRGGNQTPLDTQKRVRNRLPCQPTGLPTDWWTEACQHRKRTPLRLRPISLSPAGSFYGAAWEGERPRSPIPPHGPCPHSLHGRVCGAAREGERPALQSPRRALALTPFAEGFAALPGRESVPALQPPTGPLPSPPARKGLRGCLGGRTSPLSNSPTAPLPPLAWCEGWGADRTPFLPPPGPTTTRPGDRTLTASTHSGRLQPPHAPVNHTPRSMPLPCPIG